MPWAIADLAAAVRGRAGTDAALAAELAAQRHPPRARDIPTADVLTLLVETGEYGALLLLSRQTPAPGDALFALVAGVLNAIETLRGKRVIEVTKPGNATTLSGLLDALVSAGWLLPATRAAILALGQEAPPVWLPAPTAEDIAAARRLP